MDGKHVLIPRMSVDPNADLVSLFDQFPSLEIACCNWPGYPAGTIAARARLFHTGTDLYVRFDVDGEVVRAVETTDNGRVWEDSCVELFVSFGNGYYNIETSCIGTVLCSHRTSRNENVVMADAACLAGVERVPSLGSCRRIEGDVAQSWSLMLVIPSSTFFCDNIDSFDGVECGMNLYKCGDATAFPHFLTWAPIVTPTPDFHRPEFFRKVVFAGI